MDTSEQINNVVNNVSDKIGQAVNEVAKSLGVAAEKIYPVLIKQAYVDGVIALMWCIISSIVFYFSIKLLIKTIKSPSTRKYIYYGEEREDWTTLSATTCGITGILTGTSFLVFSCSIDNCISALVNPDWYIIQMILEKIPK